MAKPTTKRRLRRTAAVAAAGVGVGVVLSDVSRRERLRVALLGIKDSILPTAPAPGAVGPPEASGLGHALGHQHLGPDEVQDPAALGAHDRGEPWSESPAHWGAVHHRERA